MKSSSIGGWKPSENRQFSSFLKAIGTKNWKTECFPSMHWDFLTIRELSSPPLLDTADWHHRREQSAHADETGLDRCIRDHPRSPN